MLQRARHVVDRARERIRAAAEHDPHAWPDGTVLVLQDGSRAVVDHVEEPHQDDGHHATAAPRHDAAPLAPGSPHPDAPDVDVPGGVSGPPAPGGAPPAPGRDRTRGSLLAPDAGLRAAERDVPNGLRIAAAWSWRTVAVVAALYLLLRAAGYVAVVIVPVIVALLLAALLQPGAAFLRRSGWPTSLAALTMLVVGVGVVAGIVTLVVEEFVAGYADLVSQVDEGLTQVQDFITRTFPVTDGQITDALESASQSITDNRDALTSGALTTAATVGEVLTGALLTLFTLFFFLLDGRQIWLWVVGLTPVNSQAYLDEAARRSWRTLISYVRATVGVAAFDAVFIGIGLVFLGTPLVVPLAALVFLGAFIPIIGSFLAGTVSVLVTLVAVGPVRALVALGIIVLIMQLESHVLQPLLLGRAVSVHPLAVVLGIAAGLLIGGVFGALIAVPVIACGNVAGTYLSRRHEGPRPPQPDTRRARRPVTAR
ncbi:AI-2E family transporter [Modestobacter sp. VKM Ac-2984]|uniref:AI-2E family transporter n=1 Tax=Modestobacter sp. VKM Ac-2984 TaxID=3004138 RepID=UPI0022AA951F|nr:AI-2E family transporter [Modestobacter sp. VKM Ac-2984]MCZ2815835.1 AI-2E family transporter [Modestobacter sp. VKM Ac-2984]